MKMSCAMAAVAAFFLLVLPVARAQTNGLVDGAFTVVDHGATLGGWTSDLDAARALAKNRGLPLFMEFTGSDWCPYCKVVHETVFTQSEWVAYASNRFVMVFIDLPRHTPQPAAIQERNEALARTYGVEGMPTFVLLAPDGTNQISQFRLNQETTLYSFMRDTTEALLDWPVTMDRFVAGLAPAQAAAYRQAFLEFKAIPKEFSAWQATRPQDTPENRKRLDSFQTRLMQAGVLMSQVGRERVFAQLDPEGAGAQKAALAKAGRGQRRDRQQVRRRSRIHEQHLAHSQELR